MTSNIALKEWSIVVEALGSGEQLLLVRKGGIRDPKGAFQLKHREFLLYPTFEHQHEEAIRPEFRERFRPATTQEGEVAGPPLAAATALGESVQQVPLKVYAGVALCAEIRDPDKLQGLERYHIWQPQFFADRMRYRPQEPTLVVVVRAYRLKEPVHLPVKAEYVGCKSWVPLSTAIPIETAEPVVENQRFRKALNEISARLELGMG